jgi:hypothetical protein
VKLVDVAPNVRRIVQRMTDTALARALTEGFSEEAFWAAMKASRKLGGRGGFAAVANLLKRTLERLRHPATGGPT